MSNGSLIFDGLITLIESKLPAYHRMADAYDIESNEILTLEQGYSLGIAGGENTERTMCDNLYINRAYNFTVSKLYTALETDPVARATQEKALYEDAFLVWRELQKVTALGGVQVFSAKYITDEGIEYLGDDQKIITIVSAISAEYFE